MRRDELLILTYHRVGVPPRGTRIRGLYTTPAQLEWQLRWLLRFGVRFQSFRRLDEGSEAGRRGAPAAILTFDDGHRDNYTEALPVLRRLGVPAVVFAVAGDLGKRGVAWPESVEQTPTDLLTVEEVREMAAAGVEFGSHLWSHVHADRLAVPELRDQLARSRDALAEILGGPPISLAYPYGAVNEAVVEEASRAGYRYGVTTEEGPNRGMPNLLLRRVSVKGTRLHHRWRFALKVRQALARTSSSTQS